MAVPLLDLTRQYAALQDEIEAAALNVLRSCKYILGPEVEGFERDLQRYLGVPHVLAISSGTDALLVALMALGVGAGDAVVLPVYSFFATAGVVARLGARPVFVDVEPTFGTLDPLALERVLEATKNVKAVIVVHLFGAGADMPKISAICKARGLPILEDAAQAIGTRIAGKQAGQWGTCAAWSTFPSKNLGGMGDGGFFSTSDEKLAQKVKQLRNHGQSDAYRHESIGGNFRLDALQCALLRVKLHHLEEFTQRRRANALRYAELFAKAGTKNRICLPKDVPDRHTYHQYVTYVEASERDALKQRLTERQVGCAVYYPLPFHLQPCFAKLGYVRGDFPVAERLAATNLALPVFPELTPEEQREVVAAFV